MTTRDRRAYDRAYYENRSEEQKAQKVEYNRNRKARSRQMIQEFKLGKSCSCGENHPACLEFHHITDDKGVNIADAVGKGWSWEKIKSEINKCILICANCHRKLHY